VQAKRVCLKNVYFVFMFNFFSQIFFVTEFEEMMDAIERVNNGSRVRTALTPSSEIRVCSGLYKAAAALRRVVHCETLRAHITIPSVPPKYLKWLRQRRAATKEIRHMMRIGKHPNVVTLYEVLELVQDTKVRTYLFTFFLFLIVLILVFILNSPPCSLS